MTFSFSKSIQLNDSFRLSKQGENSFVLFHKYMYKYRLFTTKPKTDLLHALKSWISLAQGPFRVLILCHDPKDSIGSNTENRWTWERIRKNSITLLNTETLDYPEHWIIAQQRNSSERISWLFNRWTAEHERHESWASVNEILTCWTQEGNGSQMIPWLSCWITEHDYILHLNNALVQSDDLFAFSSVTRCR